MQSIETPLTRLLGIELPIVQAPIGSATCPALAAAVTNAGGLGTLALSWRSPSNARSALENAMELTSGPIGANIVLDPAAQTTDPATLVECCQDVGVSIVTFSFGDPGPFVERLHDTDTIVLQTVGSPGAARSAVDNGVDCVVGQGWEAGGHLQGDVATLPLIPRLVDAVPETPVIAAGGIGDGRAIAGVLALGGSGAWLGTRFLATREARVHDRYRSQVCASESDETVRGTPFDGGWPDRDHRVLETELLSELTAADSPARDRPGAEEVIGTAPDGTPIERYDDVLALPETTGAIDQLPLYAGQSVGAITDAPPAETVVERLADETVTALETATDCLTEP